MGDEPVIVVHGKDQVVAALKVAADNNVAVLLVSQRGGVSVWGAEGFKALIEIAAAEVADASFCWALDCSDNPGQALAACRTGVAGIIFDPCSPAYERVADIAAQSSVELFTPEVYERHVLDLSQVGDAPRACDTFLNGGKDCE